MSANCVWIVDATFEIQPITKGFQTVLSYNIKTQPGSTFKDWNKTRRIPYSPDRYIDETNIAGALWTWSTAVRNLVNIPKSLFFLVDVGCGPVNAYANRRFDPFKGDAKAEAFIEFLPRLGRELGFRTSFGHLTVTFTGKASTDTDAKWDYEGDCWDEDSEADHAEDVYLENENVDYTSWAFTTTSGVGILDSVNKRELAPAELLDSDWVPDMGDLSEPDHSSYEGWQGQRYQGKPGTLNISMFLIPRYLGVTN